MLINIYVVLRGKESPVKIVKYSEARKNLRSTLDKVISDCEPTCIVSKNNQVVLISKAVYDGIIDNISNAPNPRTINN